MKRVLLLQFQRLGDLLRTIPILDALRRDCPGVVVTMACLDAYAGILEDARGPDRCLAFPRETYERARGGDDGALASVFREFPALTEGYDLVVNLSYADGAPLAGAVAAPRKAGRVAPPGGGSPVVVGDPARYIYAAAGTRAESLRNLFNLVDIHTLMSGAAPPGPVAPLVPSPTRRERAENLLKHRGTQSAEGTVFFQLGAWDLRRAWPVERFAGLAARLAGRCGIRVVLLGSPRERRLARRFLEAGGVALDLVGKTDPADLPALLAGGRLLVSNDTGTLHAAAAVGLPTLGLFFSSAQFAETAAYGEGHLVLQSQVPDLDSPAAGASSLTLGGPLTVEAVGAAAEHMLEGRTGDLPARPGVLAVQAHFLGNNALLYRPVDGTGLGGVFGSRLVHRLAWERVLGLDNDPVLLGEGREVCCRDPEVSRAAADLHQEITNLRRHLGGAPRPAAAQPGPAPRPAATPPGPTAAVFQAFYGLSAFEWRMSAEPGAAAAVGQGSLAARLAEALSTLESLLR